MANKYEAIVKQFGGKYLHPPGTPENAPLSENQLAQYEVDLDYKLPADYREFLRDYGGTPFQALFTIRNEESFDDEGSIFMFQGVWLNREPDEYSQSFPIEVAPGLRKIIHLDEGVTEVDDPPRELLPIAIDMGGNQVYLALGGLQPRAIFRWMNWGDIQWVADSFDEFMHLLRPFD